MVGTRFDSTSVTSTLSPNAARRYDAVIHPDVPPPTTTTLSTMVIPKFLRRKEIAWAKMTRSIDNAMSAEGWELPKLTRSTNAHGNALRRICHQASAE